MATAKLKRKPRLSKIEFYKAANIKEVQFRLRFCVVAHGHIPGCCCSSYWADMPTPPLKETPLVVFSAQLSVVVYVREASSGYFSISLKGPLSPTPPLLSICCVLYTQHSISLNSLRSSGAPRGSREPADSRPLVRPLGTDED